MKGDENMKIFEARKKLYQTLEELIEFSVSKCADASEVKDLTDSIIKTYSELIFPIRFFLFLYGVICSFICVIKFFRR